jgi:glucosamine 6-phosphate synthetase-like amidotransferase/phosphosugar isomerase protein
MCAIFGSSKFDTFLTLYKKGLSRGDYAFGALFQHTTFFATLQHEGIANLSKDLTIKHDDLQIKLSDFNFYMGHTQAPTSAQRKYNLKTSHPFRTGCWIVAHNGVLTNYKDLAKTIKNKKNFNIVDSSLIPALLFQNQAENRPEIDTICYVLSLLKGTFGLWIYNTQSSNSYITRTGSTLYHNEDTNDFSSVKTVGMKPLKESTLYILTKEGTTAIGSYKNNSPFYII